MINSGFIGLNVAEMHAMFDPLQYFTLPCVVLTEDDGRRLVGGQGGHPTHFVLIISISICI